MNWIIGSVLLAGLMPVICAGFAKWGARGYDNHHPREWMATQSGKRVRANHAQANSLEAFPFYAAGVILGLMCGVEVLELQVIAVLFTISRVAYVFCYITDRASLRSLVWLVGFGATISLYVAAIRTL